MERRRAQHHLRLAFLTAAVLWTGVLGLGALVVERAIEDSSRRLARAESATYFDRDNALRRWVASHGGVYVMVEGDARPNPYLQVPGRDLTLPDGRQLTLMNPAFVVREINQHSGSPVGTRGRLTSSRPLNPGNAPDRWEAQALARLAAGEHPVSEVVTAEGSSFLRTLHPFFTEPTCLTCHEQHGHRPGTVHGGISVTVPLDQYLAAAASQRRAARSTLSGVWVVGSILGLIAYRRLDRLQARTTDSYEDLHRLRHRDGSWRWVLDRGRVVERDAEGQPLRITGTHLDMTDRKLAEETLRELERHDQQAAQLESLGILAGGVAHEFNNRLQIIRGNTELVCDELEERPDLHRLLQAVLAAADHSAAVCDRMQVAAGRQVEHHAAVDLVDLVTRRLDRLDPSAAMMVGVTADAARDGITGDYRQLQQLVDNLLANALEAGVDGDRMPVQVRLDRAVLTQQQLDAEPGLRRLLPGPYLRLAIEDQGGGMDAETLRRAQEPYFSTKSAGRGLGLAVVHGVLRNHGGALRIHSQPGQGTRVEVFLPVSSQQPAPPADRWTAPRPEAAADARPVP